MAQAVHAQQLYDGREHTVAQIAALLGVPRTTVYGHLNRAAAAVPSTGAATGSVPVAAVPRSGRAQ